MNAWSKSLVAMKSAVAGKANMRTWMNEKTPAKPGIRMPSRRPAVSLTRLLLASSHWKGFLPSASTMKRKLEAKASWGTSSALKGPMPLPFRTLSIERR